MSRDLAPIPDGISPGRRAVDSVLVRFFDWIAIVIVERWLVVINALMAIYVTLPIAAPILESVGMRDLSTPIYAVYSNFCHQLPYRSYFIFGHQMAYCERDTAIYVTLLIVGLAFGAAGRRWKPISFKLFALMLVPIAIDGFTQLFGWRESNWYLRTITGTLFGLASGLLVFPLVQQVMVGPEPIQRTGANEALMEQMIAAYGLNAAEIVNPEPGREGRGPDEDHHGALDEHSEQDRSASNGRARRTAASSDQAH